MLVRAHAEPEPPFKHVFSLEPSTKQSTQKVSERMCSMQSKKSQGWDDSTTFLEVDLLTNVKV